MHHTPQLLDSGTFWLSDTPHVAGSSLSGKYPRISTWAQLQQGSAKPFFVFNTHIDHTSDAVRVQQVTVLLDRIQHIAGT